MGSSCAVPDEKRGMGAAFTLTSRTPAPAVNGCPTPGEKTSGRSLIAVESLRQAGRGRGVGVRRVAPLFILGNPK